MKMLLTSIFISTKSFRFLITLLFIVRLSTIVSGNCKFHSSEFDFSEIILEDTSNVLHFSNANLIFIMSDSSNYLVVKTKCNISPVLNYSKNLIISKRLDESGSYTGIFIQIDRKSKIRSINMYIDGKKEGRCIYFRNNGVIGYMDRYATGKKVERLITFDKKGNVIGKVIDVY